jgi:hypothetical protein
MKKNYSDFKTNIFLSAVTQLLLLPFLTKNETRLKFLYAFILMVLLQTSGFGANRYSVASGNWNATSTWSASSGGVSGASAPVAGDVVFIEGSFTVTTTAIANCTTLNIALGSILNVGGFDFTVSGATLISGSLIHSNATGAKSYRGLVTVNSGGVWNNSGNSAIEFRAGITNSGTFTAGTAVQTFNTNNQLLTGNLTIPSLTVTGFVLTNNGTLTVNTLLTGSGALTNTTTLNIGGASSITTLANSGTTAVSGSGAISTALANFTNTGTLNLAGSGAITGITNNAGGTVSLASSGTITSFNNATATSILQISATTVPTFTTLTTSITGNTVNYSGAGAQTIKGQSYSNLILSGSGTKTLGAATTTTGALTLNNNTSLGMSTFLLTLNGDLVNNGTGTITGSTGGVTITGTATQNIAGFTTTGAVSMTKGTGGIATLTGNVNGGSLTISGGGGRLSLGTSLTHVFTGAWALTQGALYGGSSTLKIAGNVSTGGTFTAETGTVEFNGAAQTLSSNPLTYNNLILSGSGTKTFAAVTTVSDTWSIVSPVKANLGGFITHAAKTLLLYGTPPPLPGSSGSLASTATNKSDTYFITGSTGIINVLSVIDNNYAAYNNSTASLFASVGENAAPLTLTAPDGFVFINTKFASYGTPGGTAPNFTIGGCHAVNSRSITTGLLGSTTAIIPASGASFNAAFGDPCSGTIKSYSIVATYAVPICSGSNPGLIDGSTPTGGNGAYTYLWEVSTTSATSGYATATGTSNGEDYNPSGTLSVTTYYRRTVTSGIYSDATIVVVPVISTTAPAAPSISALCTNSTLSVPASTIPGTYVEWFSGSCGSTVLATGTSYNPTVSGTYFARYKNSCSTSLCSTGYVVSSAPTNAVIVTPSNPSSICIGTLTASLPYTASGTPNTYSITWSPNGNLIDIANKAIPNATSGTITLDIPWNAPAGTYIGTIVIKTSAGCISAGKTFTLDIGKLASAGSSTPTLCQNTVMTNITHATTGTTGIGAATGLPAGVTAAWSSNVITISGMPTASGTFNYSIPLIGNCGTANATGTITVSALPATPTASATAQPTCVVSTGTITVTAPTGMNYSIDGSNYTNTSGVFTGLAVGSYTVTAKNASGCISAATAPIAINAPITKIWNGAWSPAGAPTVDNIVIFNGSYSGGSVNACSCEINAAVTITSGVLNVVNCLTGSGSLTFNEGAYLVQVNNTNTNSANITFNLSRSGLVPYEYVYWSAPISGTSVGTAFPSYNKSYSYLNNAWVAPNTSAGRGFIVRYASATSQNPSFVGAPNNGLITVSGLSAGDNLIGNPYPSPIYASSFYSQNAGVLGGALYFWNSGTSRTISMDGTKYEYKGFYSVTNATGSVGSGDEIAPGVGFFVAGSGFVFNNDMRIAPTGSGGNFSKQANTKKTTTIDKNRVWLNLTKDSEQLSQLLLGYVTGATNDFDKLYDATTFGGTDFDFYSIDNSKQYTIQGRTLPFDTEEQIPLGYKTTFDGVFAIGIDKADGGFVGEKIYLEDKTTSTIHDLTTGSYSFTTAKGEFKDRFVLRYTTTAKLGTDDVADKGKGVIVSVKNRQIKINSFDQSITAVKVYDLKGSLLYEKNKLNNTEFIIDHLTASTHVMIIMAQLENGKWVSQETVFQN